MAGPEPHQDTVRFCTKPDIQYITIPPPEPNRRPPRSRLRMAKRLYEKYDGSQVTDHMLEEASQLFSENYGVWGKEAATVLGAFAKEGMII